MNKKILIIIILLVLLITGCSKENSKKLTIISTNFPGYDFARAITKNNDDINVKMLLKPGMDSHDFEPTPQNIIDIKNSDIFIYVGGESDEWIEDIIKSVDTNNTKFIKLMDLVNLIEDEEEKEYDEHVWTSPVNAISIINKLKDEVVKIDKDNKELYEKNSSEYINEISKIDLKIRDLVNKAKRKELVFGDRFPLIYFANLYNLKYYAAFPGCSSHTEVSSKTLVFLIDKVKNESIPVIFKIELSSSNIADLISEETGAKVLEFNTLHNISQKDFDKGVTYVDIMNKNIIVLKEALN